MRAPANVGVLEIDERILLIGSAALERLAGNGVRPDRVEWLVLTHHHRCAAEGAAQLAALGAKVAAPGAERALFEDPRSFWADDSRRVHGYHYHPSRLSCRERVPVTRGLGEYDVLEWRGQPIVALSAPGPTSGGMAYLVSVGGKTTAFVGELMASPGKLRDFYSLQGQRDFPGGTLMEYHGFGERAGDILASLERVLEHSPAALVPTWGAVSRDPALAVRRLRSRIEACMVSYHSISAGRWYFPQVWPDLPDETATLRRRCRKLPPWVLEVGGTSRIVVGNGGAGLLVDCAGDAPGSVQTARAKGRVGRIEHLWITHYHDDHVDRAAEFQNTEGCSMVAHESMADILRRPEAYCMPCLDPRALRLDRVTHDGETWRWGGFTLTALTMPGQTIFDAGLLVERDGVRVLFVGDSFTPGGLDDYCALNRNLLGPGLGYDRSLAVLQRLGPDVLLVNEHVGGAFVFGRDEMASMRAELARRRDLFAELLDWDDPNYGLDPQWARSDPYYQRVEPGRIARWRVFIHNHSRVARTFRASLRAPADWRTGAADREVRIAARSEISVELSARAPGRAEASWLTERLPNRIADHSSGPPASARYVVGIALERDGNDLGEIAEAVVDLE